MYHRDFRGRPRPLGGAERTARGATRRMGMLSRVSAPARQSGAPAAVVEGEGRAHHTRAAKTRVQNSALSKIILPAPRERATDQATPNTQHPTPNTQHPTPNTQHPTPNTQHPTPQHPTPNTQHPTPNTQHPTPNTQHPTPDTSLDGPIRGSGQNRRPQRSGDARKRAPDCDAPAIRRETDSTPTRHDPATPAPRAAKAATDTGTPRGAARSRARPPRARAGPYRNTRSTRSAA
jgi:hypothetical protein